MRRSRVSAEHTQIVKATVGAGSFVLPFCMRQMGLIPGVATIVLLGVVCVYTTLMLVRTKDMLYNVTGTRDITYVDIGARALATPRRDAVDRPAFWALAPLYAPPPSRAKAPPFILSTSAHGANSASSHIPWRGRPPSQAHVWQRRRHPCLRADAAGKPGRRGVVPSLHWWALGRCLRDRACSHPLPC